MKKLVTLDFKKGSFENGFTVSVDIRDQDTERLLAGIDNSELPSESEIPKLYSEWQSAYRGLNLRNRLEAFANQVTNVALLEDAENCEQCEQCAKTLSNLLNRWFWSPSFREARDMLIRQTSKEDDVRILLKSNDPILHRLPWHLWDLFDNSKAEFAWSIGSYILNKTAKISEKNRVLAILGSSKDINIDADRKMLESLPNAEVNFLVQPSRDELSDQLWKDKWDILFFAGHSFTQLETGHIYINETDSLQMNELRSALRKAIESGLRLAIFNSCDGLGLARSLSQLHIPQVIVMREPIPDAVAQRFLKYFLEYFSNGNSLYTSVSYARGRLEAIQDYFPCASWLPIICQNPAEESLTWKKISDKTDEVVSPIPDSIEKPEKTLLKSLSLLLDKFFVNLKKILTSRIGFLFMLIFGFVLVVIFIPLILHSIFLRPVPPVIVNTNERISYGEQFLISSKPVPPVIVNTNERISYGEQFLISSEFVKNSEGLPLRNNLSTNAFNPKDWKGTIRKFKEYLYNADKETTSKTPLQKNDPEALIYLNNAIAEQNGNFVTIAVSVPIVENPGYLIGISQEILRGVAMVQNEVNQDEKQRINGKFLKVLIAKDDNTPDDKRDVVQAIANNFVANEKILAVVGHNSTKASMAAADIYKDKLLAISPTSNGKALNDKKYYRTLPMIETDAGVLREYAAKNGWNKIGICFEKPDESSRSLKESFVPKFTENGKTTIGDGICASLKEVTADKAQEIIKNFNANGAEALLLIPSVRTIDNALEIANANANSKKLPLIANASMYTAKTKEGKDSVKGMVLVTVWHPKFNDSPESFAKTSERFWANCVINWRTATSYDAMKVIVAGLKNNSAPTRKNLMEFVSSSQLNVESSPKIQNSDGNNKIIFRKEGDRNAEIKLITIVKNERGEYDFSPYNPQQEK